MAYSNAMRFCAILVVLVSSVMGDAQSSHELEAKYGRAEHSVYTVNPDARLTVKYGDDGQACLLALEPRDDRKGVAPAVADQLLNDIAPPEVRRGKPYSMIQQMGCAAHRTEEYGNVAIGRSTDEV